MSNQLHPQRRGKTRAVCHGTRCMAYNYIEATMGIDHTFLETSTIYATLQTPRLFKRIVC